MSPECYAEFSDVFRIFKSMHSTSTQTLWLCRRPAVRHHTGLITHLSTKCHRIQSHLIIDLWAFAAVLCEALHCLCICRIFLCTEEGRSLSLHVLGGPNQITLKQRCTHSLWWPQLWSNSKQPPSSAGLSFDKTTVDSERMPNVPWPSL